MRNRAVFVLWYLFPRAAVAAIFGAPELPSMPVFYCLKVKCFYFGGMTQVGLVGAEGGSALLCNNASAPLKNKNGRGTEKVRGASLLGICKSRFNVHYTPRKNALHCLGSL